MNETNDKYHIEYPHDNFSENEMGALLLLLLAFGGTAKDIQPKPEEDDDARSQG